MNTLKLTLVCMIFLILIGLIGYLKWVYLNFRHDPLGCTVIFKSYPNRKLIRGKVIDHHNRPCYPMYLVKCETGVSERWVLKKRCFLYPF